MKKKYLLVDGYNVIYGIPDLRGLMERNLESARGRLQDMLCNYQGYSSDEVILVFDGYKGKNPIENIIKYHNITVVFTKEGETADTYIEKINQSLAKEYIVRVVTSDFAQQKMILGQGATRVPVREFELELKKMNKEIEKEHLAKLKKRNCLIDNLSKENADLLGQLRLMETDE